MFVTLKEEIVQELQALAADGPVSNIKQPLYGRRLDNNSVIQVLSLHPEGLMPVGYALHTQEPSLAGLASPVNDGQICLCLDNAKAPSFSCFIYDNARWQPVDYEIVRIQANFYQRLQGLFDTGYLFDKKVTIIGLGTGGGLITLELAKNGVGHFQLVDFDRLQVHNVARHVCGLSDLGRYKTKAVAELIHNHHPQVMVTTAEYDILENRAKLKEIVTGSDLVIAATDSERSKRLINQVCWPQQIPVIYGAAYDRAFGGDVIRVIPPDTACYECAFKQLVELFETAPRKGEIDYAAEDVSKVIAEPGLGLDVAFIALIMSKMALLTLLRGSESTLEDLPADWILWGNQATWVFEKPLESIFMEVPVNPTCPVCRYEAYMAAELGMTIDEAEAAGKAILESIQPEN
ncbi:MAG: ThiF family adenylyltransferase [Anaerolineae bacterium]|nr:ThiF family adenylyltransferase [Anaerolineae bacterium]